MLALDLASFANTVHPVSTPEGSPASMALAEPGDTLVVQVGSLDFDATVVLERDLRIASALPGGSSLSIAGAFVAPGGAGPSVQAFGPDAADLSSAQGSFAAGLRLLP